MHSRHAPDDVLRFRQSSEAGLTMDASAREDPLNDPTTALAVGSLDVRSRFGWALGCMALIGEVAAAPWMRRGNLVKYGFGLHHARAIRQRIRLGLGRASVLMFDSR
jgi:hypothetical protein